MNNNHANVTTYRRWQASGLHASICLLGLLFITTLGQAESRPASLEFVTRDANGHPLEHVVASLHAEGMMSAPGSKSVVNIMDQRDLQFAPAVLAVQTGTTVKFPNDDDVRHHVYSFSHPNAFELKLYHGESGADRTFEHAGVVVLGCNIHDGMLGYLRVVDSPYFSTSTAEGKLAIDKLPPGKYELQVWHPDLGMKLVRKSLTVKPGVNKIDMRVAIDGSDTPPPLKAAHPLQSLFRD